MTHPDGVTRTHVLEALVHCHEKSGAPEISEARSLILREAEEAAWALAAREDTGDDAAFAELSRAFLSEFEERKQHIFLLLSLLYPPAVIRKARLDLDTTAGEKKAHALEVLDNLLTPDLKKKIFSLLDSLSPHERFKQLSANFPQTRLDRTARLRETIDPAMNKAGAWTKCCALFVAGRSRDAAWSEAALVLLQDRNEMVRETAVWALSRVNDGVFRQCAAALKNDLNPAIARLSQQLLMQGKPHAVDH